MLYLLLKALHVTAVITWLSGMLVVTVAVNPVSLGHDVNQSSRSTLLYRLSQWERYMTTPSMLIVWAAGLTLAISGHWFPQPWLMAKLALVLLLSALHGLLIGRLRKASKGHVPDGIASSHHLAVAIVVMAFIIVALVVLKPF